MAERASTRVVAARAAPLAKSPSRDAATTRRNPAAAPSGPPVLRLVARPRSEDATTSEERLAALLASPGAGEPIPEPVRRQLESSLKVDLSRVRVHTDPRTRSAVDAAGARAFAHGTRIFLGSGEAPTDVRLMAHEAAHVVQQQGGPRIQTLSGSGHPDALEREAHSVSSAVASGEHATVTGRTAPRPQFSALDWVKKGVSSVGSAVSGAVSAVADTVGDIAGAALSFIKDKARVIPGYDMLGLIIGRDPITQQPVPRNAVNLIKGVMGLWPGGSMIFEALQNHGIIDKVGAWLDAQLEALKPIVAGIRKALDQFIATLGLGDLVNLGGAWDRAKRIFSEPIDRAVQFVEGTGDSVLGFIRDAILLPIAEARRRDQRLRPAEGGPRQGSDHRRAGAAGRRDADRRLHEVHRPGGDLGEHQEGQRALPRAWAWFQKALAELMGFVAADSAEPFISALKSLDITDMILVPSAFAKLGAGVRRLRRASSSRGPAAPSGTCSRSSSTSSAPARSTTSRRPAPRSRASSRTRCRSSATWSRRPSSAS